MKNQSLARASVERRFVAGIVAVLGATVWTHGLAGVTRHLGPADAPLAALGLTLAAIAVALIGATAMTHRRGVAVGALGGGMVGGLLAVIVPGSAAAALALVPVGGASTLLARWVATRLPRSVDGALVRHRTAAVVWALIALASVVQVGRLSTMMTDWTCTMTHMNHHPFWHGHQCLSAYVYGAELVERGDPNVYDTAHYPGLNPEAKPETRIAGMPVEDPYQYPPQFLVLPRLALSLTDDFGTIRVVWFALQFTFFASVFAAMARWVGGRAGRVALWLFPVVAMSLPVLFNFQFGQFHLAAVTLAIAAMLAFARGRTVGGGALLATAILAKIFPAVLLVPMLVQRRVRDLAWTAGWGVALTVVALALLGPTPFVSFLEYHMPRMASGAAFAFDEAWPELADLVVTDNQGAFGLARKFGLDKPAAAWVGRSFAIALMGLAAFVGFRLRGTSHRRQALGWLGLVGLATLASPGAWADYIGTTAMWILALSASQVMTDRRWLVAVGTVVLLQFFLLGTMPIGTWAPIPLMTVVSAIGSLSLFAVFTGAALGRPAEQRVEDASTPPIPDLGRGRTLVPAPRVAALATEISANRSSLDPGAG